MSSKEVMVDEIPFPAEITTTRPLALVGQGITDVEIHFLQIKYNAIGIYMEQDVIQYLENWKGKKGTELEEDNLFFDALVSAPVEKVFRIVVIKEIKGSQFGVQLESAVRDRLAVVDKYEEEEEEELEKVTEFFQSIYLKKDSVITFYFPATSSTAEITFITEGKGERKIQVVNANVVEMMQKWYLGGSRAVSPSTILCKMEIEAKLDTILTEWNQEFVKIKYQYGESIRRWKVEIEESSSLKDQLSQCRAEMALMATSLSLKQQELDRSRDELVATEAEKIFLESGQKTLEEEKQKLQNLLLLKESEAMSNMKLASIKAIEDFKSSIEYRLGVQDCIEEAQRTFNEVEGNELKNQFLEEGFTRGFLKGTRLVHRKTGATLDGISMSEVSKDESSSSDGSSNDSSSDDASSEEIDILSH